MGYEIKICGLANIADATKVLELGADYLGFILYSGSSRCVTLDELRNMSDALPPDCRKVGVFVNENRETVLSIADKCGLYAVQLHGDELSENFPDMPVPVWRSLRVSGDSVEPDPGEWPAERYVVDSAVAGVYGGSGVTADWKTASSIARRFPVMLAGGLTPDNVAEAARVVRPLGVDVAGGVEASPGKKDLIKMKKFIANARQ